MNPFALLSEIIIPLAALMIPLILVAGFTFNFLVKPALLTLRPERESGEPSALRGELAVVRAEVEDLRDQLRSLRDARDFDRMLAGSSGAESGYRGAEL